MRHGVKTKKLGRPKAHREATLRNLVRALFIYERIRTTLAKARLTQRLAERMISYGQTGTLAARRNALSVLPEKAVIKKLFDDIAPRFKDRQGGCTRVLHLGPRPTDGSEMVFLELVVRKPRPDKDEKEKDEKKKKK